MRRNSRAETGRERHGDAETERRATARTVKKGMFRAVSDTILRSMMPHIDHHGDATEAKVAHMSEWLVKTGKTT